MTDLPGRGLDWLLAHANDPWLIVLGLIVAVYLYKRPDVIREKAVAAKVKAEALNISFEQQSADVSADLELDERHELHLVVRNHSTRTHIDRFEACVIKRDGRPCEPVLINSSGPSAFPRVTSPQFRGRTRLDPQASTSYT